MSIFLYFQVSIFKRTSKEDWYEYIFGDCNYVSSGIVIFVQIDHQKPFLPWI